jgi:hypothetical protein
MFGQISVGFTQNEIISIVLPALLTLSSDPERKVQMGALKPLITLTLLSSDETVSISILSLSLSLQIQVYCAFAKFL